MKLIIDIPEEAYNRLLTEQRFPNRFDIEWCIVHGTPIQDNASNGDVIKAMFPDAEIRFLTTLSGIHTVAVDFMDNMLDQSYCMYTFNFDWWNAPYQKENKNE